VSTEDDDQVRPFAAILAEIGGGKLHARLSEQLAALTAAVADTGKKGQLTIQIKVEPFRKGGDHSLMVTGTSSAKVPEGEDASPASVFFTDNGGNLRRDDPRQAQLPLIGLAGGKATTA
jgi:hypothetical protein